MGTKSNQIVTEIDAQRSRLGRNLVELESRLRDATDWRGHYAKHPFAATGLAFGAGLLVGAWVRGSKRKQPFYASVPPVYQKEVSTTMDHIKGALIAFGIATLKDLVTQALPELKPHLRAAAPPGR